MQVLSEQCAWTTKGSSPQSTHCVPQHASVSGLQTSSRRLNPGEQSIMQTPCGEHVPATPFCSSMQLWPKPSGGPQLSSLLGTQVMTGFPPFTCEIKTSSKWYPSRQRSITHTCLTQRPTEAEFAALQLMQLRPQASSSSTQLFRQQTV